MIAISFLGLYLFSATELYQLAKLPILIQHFLEHRQENKNLGFFAFLELHYASGNIRDADYARDMQLPFKTHEGCLNLNIQAPVPALTGHELCKPVTDLHTSFPVIQHALISIGCPNTIWQPPKFC